MFESLRQPAVIGKLLVGIIIGPHALALIGTPSIGLVDLFQGADCLALCRASVHRSASKRRDNRVEAVRQTTETEITAGIRCQYTR